MLVARRSAAVVTEPSRLLRFFSEHPIHRSAAGVSNLPAYSAKGGRRSKALPPSGF